MFIVCILVYFSFNRPVWRFGTCSSRHGVFSTLRSFTVYMYWYCVQIQPVMSCITNMNTHLVLNLAGKFTCRRHQLHTVCTWQVCPHQELNLSKCDFSLDTKIWSKNFCSFFALLSRVLYLRYHPHKGGGWFPLFDYQTRADHKFLRSEPNLRRRGAKGLSGDGSPITCGLL